MQIMSRVGVGWLVAEEPSKYNAILIYEPGDYDKIEPVVGKCKNALPLGFLDVTRDTDGGPTKQQVEEALNWMTPDVVACNLGSSRSAALAYLIGCQIWSPKEAAELWNVSLHYPNEMVLKHGVELLGDEIIPPIKEFYAKVAERKKWRYELVTKFFRDFQ